MGTLYPRNRLSSLGIIARSGWYTYSRLEAMQRLRGKMLAACPRQRLLKLGSGERFHPGLRPVT